MKNSEPIRLSPEREEEYVMKAIVDSYEHMEEEDLANWSIEAARALAQDFAQYDAEFGLAPIHYDPEDIYDTILALREADDDEPEDEED